MTLSCIVQELKHQLTVAESALGIALCNCGPQAVLDVLPLRLDQVQVWSRIAEVHRVLAYLPVVKKPPI